MNTTEGLALSPLSEALSPWAAVSAFVEKCNWGKVSEE